MRPGSVRLTVLSVIVVTAIAAPAAAQALYRWVDEDGVVHYSQFPPPAPAAPLSPPTRSEALIGARGETAVTARREAVAPALEKTRAGSRGEALRTARAEAVAR